jgi:hypothetical protein
MSLVMSHVAARSELAGVAPGFAVVVADGMSTLVAAGQTPAYVTDSTTYAVEVLS